MCTYIYIQRRQWQPTPVLLPGKSHGWRSLVGCSPWGRWELDMTQWLHFHFSLSWVGEGNGDPLQCSCLENPREGVAWWAAGYGVAQSWAWLERLSSSSSNRCFFTDHALGSLGWVSASREGFLAWWGRSGILWPPCSCSLGPVVSWPGMGLSCTFHGPLEEWSGRGREPAVKESIKGLHSWCSSKCYKACLPLLILTSLMRMLIKLRLLCPCGGFPACLYRLFWTVIPRVFVFHRSIDFLKKTCEMGKEGGYGPVCILPGRDINKKTFHKWKIFIPRIWKSFSRKNSRWPDPDPAWTLGKMLLWAGTVLEVVRTSVPEPSSSSGLIDPVLC